MSAKSYAPNPTPPASAEPLLLAVPAAAALLGVSSRWLWMAISRGEVPVVRLGRRVLLARPDLEAFIDEHRVAR